MFTGIIEELGVIEHIDKLGGGIRLRILCPKSAPELSINDSVAVNGVCLTTVVRDDRSFGTIAVEETLLKTNLGGLHEGSTVNLELPLRFNDRLGGHLLLGHVDTTARVTAIEKQQNSWIHSIGIERRFMKYIIPVGSIAVDGVSLTVARIRGTTISVSIIPHTIENTIFSSYTTGSIVNIEFDLVGKYIERMMKHEDGPDAGRSPITVQTLKDHGY